VIRHLGAPAVIVGHSLSGGAATIAAAKAPELVSGIVATRAKLTEPGRMAEFMKTFKSTPADAAEQLPNVQCPALIVMGAADPDFADPKAEGDAIAAAMSAGLATVATIDGAGHYPQGPVPGRGRRPYRRVPEGQRPRP